MSSLITAVHEDGLADFCDSYGGNTKKRKLEIMGDSSIGAYVVYICKFISFDTVYLHLLSI